MFKALTLLPIYDRLMTSAVWGFTRYDRGSLTSQIVT
jgi:hypothetical protein